MSTVVIVLCAMILVVAAPSGMSRTAWTGDSSEGPVFVGYTLPDGDLWTSQDFPVEVWVSDADGVGTVCLSVLENDTWVELYLSLRYQSNTTTGLYDLFLPFAVPSPGLVVNYTFRFKANDTLGNMAYTGNITTSVYRGEGPIFVDYDLPWGGTGRLGCNVMVDDPDGIDTVQLHIWDPHTGLWSAQVMLHRENPWTESAESGEEYFCFYNVMAPYNEPPAIYKFRLEANDTLGNSVLSCELSRWYLEMLTIDTGIGPIGLPPLEVLVAAALVPAGIAVVVLLYYVRRRP